MLGSVDGSEALPRVNPVRPKEALFVELGKSVELMRAFFDVRQSLMMPSGWQGLPTARRPRILERLEYDIGRIDLDRLRKEFESSPAKSTVTLTLKKMIEKCLQTILAQNP